MPNDESVSQAQADLLEKSISLNGIAFEIWFRRFDDDAWCLFETIDSAFKAVKLLAETSDRHPDWRLEIREVLK